MPWLAALSPRVLAVVAVAAGVVVMLGIYELRLHDVRGDLAAAKAEARSLQLDVAQGRVRLMECTSNRNALEGALREQTRAVEALEQRARQLESEASLRAVRRLQQGEAARREARAAPDATAGPEGMNAWLRDSLLQ